MGQLLCGHLFSVPLGAYLAVELLHHVVTKAFKTRSELCEALMGKTWAVSRDVYLWSADILCLGEGRGGRDKWARKRLGRTCPRWTQNAWLHLCLSTTKLTWKRAGFGFFICPHLCFHSGCFSFSMRSSLRKYQRSPELGASGSLLGMVQEPVAWLRVILGPCSRSECLTSFSFRARPGLIISLRGPVATCWASYHRPEKRGHGQDSRQFLDSDFFWVHGLFFYVLHLRVCASFQFYWDVVDILLLFTH